MSMPSPTGAATATASGENAGADRSDADVLQLGAAWLRETGAALGTSCRLAVAEAKLAAMSFVLMLVLSVFAAVLLLGAWGLLLTGAVLLLDAQGVSLWASLGGLGLVQVLGALALFRSVSRLGERLELAETNRRIEQALGGEDERHA